MCAAARFPAASDATKQRILRFLATHGLFTPQPAKLGKTKIRELQQAGGVQPPVSPDVRQLCACRLVSMLGAAAGHAPQQAKAQAPAGAQGALRFSSH